MKKFNVLMKEKSMIVLSKDHDKREEEIQILKEAFNYYDVKTRWLGNTTDFFTRIDNNSDVIFFNYSNSKGTLHGPYEVLDGFNEYTVSDIEFPNGINADLECLI